MSDGFHPVTKWLPTYVQDVEDRHTKVDLDADLSSWVEHFKRLGLTEGKDFQVRRRKKDGKKAVFRCGKSPFQDTDKYYPHSSRSNGR